MSFAANHFHLVGSVRETQRKCYRIWIGISFFSFIAGNETREGSSCERDRNATDPGVEEEKIVNPYPLVIVPKYGSPTPLKNRGICKKNLSS